jgi:hypothetical protein
LACNRLDGQIPLTALERAIVDAVRDERDPAKLEERLARRKIASAAQTRRALFIALSAGIVASPSWNERPLG